jgi:pilus assembly protein TadC
MIVVAALVAVSVFFLVIGGRRVRMADRLSIYLLPVEPMVAPAPKVRSVIAPAWLPAVVLGGLVGALLAQGDLFLAGAGRSVPALTIVGSAAGYFTWSIRRTNTRERIARRLRYELPVVADAVALHIIAGNSVSAAIDQVTGSMEGVAIDELERVSESVGHGTGLAEALLEASRGTAHKDGRRFYDLLGHAHESGGRLATMLSELAVDLRAGMERDLSAEGGKRAVATYGPVLALMVPTALLFLLYPTLIGLRELSGTQ